jgi:hypothetical protein
MVDPSVDVWLVRRSMNPTAQKEAGSRRTTQNIKTIRNNMFLYSYFSHDSVVPKLDAPAICKGVVPSIWPLQFLTSL